MNSDEADLLAFLETVVEMIDTFQSYHAYIDRSALVPQIRIRESDDHF